MNSQEASMESYKGPQNPQEYIGIHGIPQKSMGPEALRNPQESKKIHRNSTGIYRNPQKLYKNLWEPMGNSAGVYIDFSLAAEPEYTYASIFICVTGWQRSHSRINGLAGGSLCIGSAGVDPLFPYAHTYLYIYTNVYIHIYIDEYSKINLLINS